MTNKTTRILSLSLLSVLLVSVVASVVSTQQANALSAITFTTKTTISSTNTQFQRVYENGTNSVITLDATSGATYQKNTYNVAAGTAASATTTLSGSGNTINSAAYVSPVDLSKYSISLNGSTQYVSIPYQNIGHSITFVISFKPNAALGVDTNLLSFMKTLLRVDSGTIKWYPNTGTSSNVAATLNSGTWYQVYITQISGTNNYEIYVNGLLAGNGTAAAAVDTSNQSNQIGAFFGTNNCNCKIDDVLLYNKVLNSSERAIIFAHGLVTSGLVAFYDMNDGVGTSTSDLSGGGNTGTLVNTPTWSSDVDSNSFSRPTTYITGRDTATGKNGYGKINISDLSKVSDSYQTSSYYPRAISQSTTNIYSPLYDATADGNIRLGIQTRAFGSYSEPSIYTGTPTNPAHVVLATQDTGTTAVTVGGGVTNRGIAEHITTSGALQSKTIDTLTLSLKKEASTTGTATIGTLDSSNNIVTTFASLDVSTLTTSQASYRFTFSPYTVSGDTRIGIKFTGGDATHFVTVYDQNSDVYDSTNSVFSASNGATWSDTTSADLRFIATYSQAKIAVVDGSPDTEYVVFVSGANNLALVKYTNSATTLSTSLSHTTGADFSLIPMSGKIIIQTATTTYSLNTSTDAITTLYSSTFLTRYPQTFTISPSARTYSSTAIMFANSTYAATVPPSTGTFTQTGVLVSSTNDGAGTLTTYQPSSWYYLPTNTLSLEGPATTWTIKAIGSSIQVAPTAYSEHLGVSLTANSTLYADNVFRLVCNTGSYHVIYSKYAIGSDSDCTKWLVLATSSNTVGRELYGPYSRTQDLVHTSPQSAYSFQLTATDPTVYTLYSIYNGKTVDVAGFDASGQAQQRYLYGQCYTIQLVNSNDASTVNPGTICANDLTTKTINLLTVNVPQNWTDAGWHYNVTRSFGNTTSNIQFQVAYNPNPYTARVLTTDNYLSAYQTYHTWYNFTNVNGTSTVAVSKPNNATVYFIVYDGSNIPRLTVASHGKAVSLAILNTAFAPIGDLFGVPLTAFFVVLGSAIFVKSNSPFGVLVVVALAAFLFATGMLSITAAAWGGIMVVAALGVLYAVRRY